MTELKSLNTGKPVQVGDRLYTGLHSVERLTEYEILAINTTHRKVWAAVVMSPRHKPVGLRDWFSAKDLDCVWIK